jgi:hypothetical protein
LVLGLILAVVNFQSTNSIIGNMMIDRCLLMSGAAQQAHFDKKLLETHIPLKNSNKTSIFITSLPKK